MRIATYNVRFFSQGTRGLFATRTRLVKIAEAIAALDDLPHVLCLQEVEPRSLRSAWSLAPDQTQHEAFLEALHRALERMGHRLGYRGFHFPAHESRFVATGNSTLVRDDVTVIDCSEGCDVTCRERGPVERRVIGRVGVSVAGRAWDVFNTHLNLPLLAAWRLPAMARRMGFEDNQVREAAAVARFVREDRKQERVVLVGDLNAQPGSPAYDTLIADSGLVDAFARFAAADAAELRASWPTASFAHIRVRLDHVLVSPGVRTTDVADTHPVGARGRWRGLSDHVQIVMRLGDAPLSS